VRNGTQNLFAALQVHSGEVSGMASKTRNRFDFIAFLDRLEDEIPPDKSVVGILDNLSTHKTQEVEAWLDEHPRWRFHFTPKHASWLNQVEIFFSILQRRLIQHGIFDSEDDLATQMLPSSSTTTSQPGRLSGPTPARCSLYRAGTCGMNH